MKWNPRKAEEAKRRRHMKPVKNKQMKTVRKRSKLISGRSSDSQEESESGTKQQKCRKVLSSEEKEHEDTSWAKVSRSRKSSSGTSADAEKTNIPDDRKSRGHREETDLDLVLAAFIDFCDKYRESVVSKAVKQSIDSFSNNVKEQLLKKISFYKEFRFLKRQNAKVGSLICRKTQRLLDAKNELMRAERQVRLLQTEKAELQLRLADLRLGYTFLHDIRELNTQYLRYRHKHHKENETYGASSKPAMLLEQQQKGINQETEKTEGSWE
ncbi:centromere protein U isoform X2 [Betta splendens]|uniref:Centromere protein U n=1 Tax=Betta splendens TaxID=158456 RepID=A0A8M1HJE8_BETSP|nr:centromere protein U isoform X2 [Betta splendens]